MIEGEKWSAMKWIHVRSYDKPEDHTTSSDCIDENETLSGLLLVNVKKILYSWSALRIILEFVERVVRLVHYRNPFPGYFINIVRSYTVILCITLCYVH